MLFCHFIIFIIIRRYDTNLFNVKCLWEESYSYDLHYILYKDSVSENVKMFINKNQLLT